jgi:hypothetical protein
MSHTKAQLQNKTDNEKQEVLEEVAGKFNDRHFHSGGLVSDHTEYVTRELDPELPNSSGLITDVKVWHVWKEMKKDYAEAKYRWDASGHDSGDNFYDFCQGNVNSLYMFQLVKICGQEFNL